MRVAIFELCEEPFRLLIVPTELVTLEVLDLCIYYFYQKNYYATILTRFLQVSPVSFFFLFVLDLLALLALYNFVEVLYLLYPRSHV